MAFNLGSLFGQTTQTQTPATKYTGAGGLTYDPSIYQQGVANSDPYAYTTGWSGLDSLGAGAGITGAIGDPNNPTGFNASRSLQPGDTRNGYEINTLNFNPDGTIKYDPNSWTFQEYKPDGGWLRPALTWAGLAAGTAGLGGLLAGGASAGAGAGLSGMDLAADAALGTGNNIATAGSALGGGAGTIAGTTIPQFQQLPGYGEQFGGPLAQAGNGSPYTLGGEVGGTGLAPSQAGAATGNGFNFAGATPGSVVGTGEGLGIASGAAGGIGAGLGAGIGASIPTGTALAGTALGGAGAGSGSGLASQFLGNAAGAAGGGILDAIKTIPGATGMGNSVVGKLLGSVLGGTGGGISGLGNLGSLFTNYNQYDNYKDLIGEIKGIYSPEGQYAKYLEQQLGRRDAAAGRNSQYGPRLAEMMGRLGDSQARALSGLGPMLQGQQGGLNGMVGAGQRLLDGAGGLQSLWNMFSGGGGGSQGGMIPTPTTNGGQYIPNPEYNPVDDNWWTNPQAGP